ncbi:hypothetical protein Lal_00047581 [Lupinus albus]|nr:hypothetical protein Lal_00047581 [Lupinus albus]
MKMGNATIGGSKRRVSNKGVGGVLREQRAKLYIIRRVEMSRLEPHSNQQEIVGHSNIFI